MAAKSGAILDRHSTRWRSRTAVGAEEWLRRGQTKEWAQKQVSCQDFVITIREGCHQFSWHKKQEQSRISPSDTVVMLILRLTRRWLRAGVMLEGIVTDTVVGAPQGAPISALLSNIYLHPLDVYWEQEVRDTKMIGGRRQTAEATQPLLWP